MVEATLTSASEADTLRERATRYREIAREYHSSVAAPLYETAAELDREAARLARGGVDRRERTQVRL